MHDGWITLRTFISDLEAQEVRSRLEASGLRTMLEVDNCGGMRPHLDYTTGVKLLVPEEEADQARELMLTADTAPEGDPWSCSRCDENIEPVFDACWKCGQARE